MRTESVRELWCEPSIYSSPSAPGHVVEDVHLAGVQQR